MTANKPETALYRAPTLSLLLVSHGGLVHVVLCVYVYMCTVVRDTNKRYTLNHDIHVVLNSCGFSLKTDSWKSSAIYFMQIYNTGVLLVSDGKFSCDLICACSDDSH